MGSEARPLDGYAALVTGGSGGIGSSAARFLARDGCAVVLMARNEARLASMADDIRQSCDPLAPVEYLVGDGSQGEDVSRGIDRAIRITGRLDIVVATVGGGSVGPILALS